MSEQVIRVPVEQLRQVFELLVHHVAQRSGADLVTSKDYFWSLPPSSRYDVYSEPSEFTVGQVSEAWGNLQELLADESKVLGYGLVWLADVLRAIGDESIG
jgi:hypothetical protein